MQFKALKLAAISMAIFAGASWAAPATVYIADEGSDTVSVVDVATFNRVSTVAVGRAPHNVQVSPDGRLAWVTNEGKPSKVGGHASVSGDEHEKATERGELWAIDVDTGGIAAKIPVGAHPAHVVLTPDGRFAYVTNGGDGTVSVVDTEARKLVATVQVGSYPHGVRISPDGKQAYVANMKGGTVSVIDTQKRTEVAQIPVGKGPAQTGFAPDGSLAFVSLSQENKVALINPVDRRVVAKIDVGTVPIQLHATPDGKTLFVANQGTKGKPGTNVSVIDLQTRRVVKTVETGSGAHGVVVDREGRYAFVTNIYGNTLSVLDARTFKVVATVPVGQSPNGVSVTP